MKHSISYQIYKKNNVSRNFVKNLKNMSRNFSKRYFLCKSNDIEYGNYKNKRYTFMKRKIKKIILCILIASSLLAFSCSNFTDTDTFESNYRAGTEKETVL